MTITLTTDQAYCLYELLKPSVEFTDDAVLDTESNEVTFFGCCFPDTRKLPKDYHMAWSNVDKCEHTYIKNGKWYCPDEKIEIVSEIKHNSKSL